MTPEQVNQAVQSYLTQYEAEQTYRAVIQGKISELEKQLQESQEKNLYMLIYKREYGDYKKFVEHVAERLRVINAECKHCYGKGKVNICSYPCQNIWEEVRCGECLGTGRIQHPAAKYLDSLEGK